TIAVLDAHGVTALADPAERARLRALADRVADVVIPAAVLAEFVTGTPTDHHVNRLIDAARIAAIPKDIGLVAGRLRTTALRTTKRKPSAIDALVVAVAHDVATADSAVIVTSDPADIS